MGKLHLHQPKFRSTCRWVELEDHIQVTHFGEGFDLFPDEGATVAQLKGFLDLIDGTRSVAQLQEQAEGFSAEQVRTLLEALDENWLLAEGKPPELKGKSGIEFILELEDLYRQWEMETGETEFTSLFLDGKAPKNVVLGYSFEYYHITKRCHESVSPAIAKAHGPLRGHLLEFFLEEYRHDKLLIKSLTSLGFREEEIVRSIPLPYTAAVMNLLAKWAHTDLLSFMASLFIFEGTDLDGNEYMESLESYGFSQEFVQHQNTHNDINIEGDHGNVTRDMFAAIDYVSPEDQERVIRNLRLLYETNNLQHQNVVDYYSRPDAAFPRQYAFNPVRG